MFKFNRTFVFITAVLILICSQVKSIDFDLKDTGSPIEEVQLHAFFSQGFMKSNNNNVFGESKDGTFDLREFGFNFSGNINPSVMLAAQFMGYSLGDQGDDQLNLHYGLIDINLNEAVGFRIGRVRVAAGLYNETRDIDMLRNSVFLPQSIYPEILRDYFASADALAIYGGFDLDDLGYLSYQAHIGKLTNSKDRYSDLPFLIRGSSGIIVDDLKDGRSSGGHIKWDTPINGLRCAWSWRRVDNTISFKPTTFSTPGGDIVVTPPTITADDYVNEIWSIEYEINSLTLKSELSHQTEDGKPDTTGWYVGADYDLNEKFAFGGNYSRWSIERGSSYGDIDMLYGFSNSVSFFGKYNINDNWLIKAQLDFMRGIGRNQGMVATRNDEVDNILFSIKTTLSF